MSADQQRAQEFISKFSATPPKDGTIQKTVDDTVAGARRTAESLASKSPKRETESKRDEARLTDKSGKRVSPAQPKS